MPSGIPILASEQPLLVFVSSVIRPSVSPYRERAVEVLTATPSFRPWAFEGTPAPSESVVDGYLRHVREADAFLLCLGNETTEPVLKEIETAIDAGVPLWVFRLENVGGSEPDEQTLKALDRIGSSAKYTAVRSVADFEEQLRKTTIDEIARAWRRQDRVKGARDAGEGREYAALLEILDRESRARCVARWQPLGITRQNARALAADDAVGAAPRLLMPTPGQPLRIIVADFGAGKSLCLERALQQAIVAARSNDDAAATPVYVQAAKGLRLREEVMAQSAALRGFSKNIFVVLDGLDEAGPAEALRLLDEARTLVESDVGARVLAASRPLPGLTNVEEIVRIPDLTGTAILEIAGRFAGRVLGSTDWYAWPQPVQEAARRPLFAIILGVWSGETHPYSPRSTGELLESVVSRALRAARVDASTVQASLERLAVSVMLTGTGATAGELRARREFDTPVGAGVVVERAGRYEFPLPILAQWFAAHAVARRAPSIEEIVASGDLDRWRYPLIILASAFDSETVDAVLAVIACSDPGFAASIVAAGVRPTGMSTDAPAPPALVAARRVRTAMTSWVAGIGPTAPMVAPVRADGTVMPLGAFAEEAELTTAWYLGVERRPDISEVALTEIHPFACDSRSRWIGSEWSRPGGSPGWPWRMTLGQLAGELGRRVAAREFAPPPSALAEEDAWVGATAILKRGSLDTRPISVEALDRRLSGLPLDEPIYTWWQYGTGTSRHDLRHVGANIRRLRASGATEWACPLPAADLWNQPRCHFIWGPYSPLQLLARIEGVFRAAVESYPALIATWFPGFARRMRHLELLPALL